MASTFLHRQTLEKIQFSEINLHQEYEDCTFSNCNFENVDLSGIKFSTCTFVDCNISLAKLRNTTLQDIRFISCKMMGLQFDTCNTFGISFYFENCHLQHSTFVKMKIKGTIFKNCQLQETVFAEADASQVIFDQCNLTSAIFDRTLLEKADFRTAFNYTINPEINRIKKAKFSLQGLEGLLQKYQIEVEK